MLSQCMPIWALASRGIFLTHWHEDTGLWAPRSAATSCEIGVTNSIEVGRFALPINPASTESSSPCGRASPPTYRLVSPTGDQTLRHPPPCFVEWNQEGPGHPTLTHPWVTSSTSCSGREDSGYHGRRAQGLTEGGLGTVTPEFHTGVRTPLWCRCSPWPATLRFQSSGIETLAVAA